MSVQARYSDQQIEQLLTKSASLRTGSARTNPASIFLQGVATGAAATRTAIVAYEISRDYWNSRTMSTPIRKEDCKNVTVISEVQRNPETGETVLVTTQTGTHPSSSNPLVIKKVVTPLENGIPSELRPGEELSLGERFAENKEIVFCKHKRISIEDITKQQSVIAEAERAMNEAGKIRDVAFETTRRALANALNDTQIELNPFGPILVKPVIVKTGDLFCYDTPA